MALFIMKWMDLSLKECRMQGLSFFAPLRSLGIVLVDILEESNSATELLRFLGHMTRSFSWSKIQFRLLELLHQRSNSMSLLEKGDLSIFVSASLGFRELDSSRDFYVTFGCGGLIWIMVLSRCFYGLEMMLSPSSNEKFSSLVLRKPSASSVLNGMSVWLSEFNIVIVIEELIKSICFFYGKGYTAPLSSSRSFEVRRSMALFIMKWMDLSFKECRMQGLSFLRASPFHWLLDFSSFGIVLVDILEESNSSTELLRFLGHMTRCFRGARSSFGSSSFCIRDRTRCHYWRRATCRSFVFHELVRGRFLSASLGFRELDSSRDFCVAFGSGENSSSLEGERGVLVVVVAQLFSSSISSKILASLVVGVENGYDEVNVKIPAEYKPATDRSEYDDQNTDEPSSVITQLPHMHAVRSLRSDRARAKLGRYVATERPSRSVAT
ncbi:hypothetical protein F2Q68_00016604 [Brassica cretica]|uniref:Uncharacterized protein n=1 Tax=Brassica cretica TaxID=69181 RepID=A0A8S9HL11_BRACR|nr:hypothetical protein F2Q68_00016604 [Brassica cretica]